MNKEELRTHVAKQLEVNEEDLIWSEESINPLTIREENGVVKANKGYWVKRK